MLKSIIDGKTPLWAGTNEIEGNMIQFLQYMKRDLEYYQNLEYDIQIKFDEFEGKIIYTVYADELGEHLCYGTGETIDAAISHFLQEKNDFIEFLYKKGLPIPEPKDEKIDE